MVWNSPPWIYGVRHQRGLESLLLHHKDACVVVFSETIELDFFKDNFVKDAYKMQPSLAECQKKHTQSTRRHFLNGIHILLDGTMIQSFRAFQDGITVLRDLSRWIHQTLHKVK